MNKAVLWFVIFFLCISGAMAFNTYDCGNSNVIYDTFGDSAINSSLWNWTDNTGIIVNEQATFINMSPGYGLNNGIQIAQSITTNTTKNESKVMFGAIGAGSCQQYNINGVDYANGAQYAYINNQLIVTVDSVVNFNMTITLWRDGDTLYWNATKNWTTNDSGTIALARGENYYFKYNVSRKAASADGTAPEWAHINGNWINQSGILYLKLYDETLNTIINSGINLQKSDNISSIIKALQNFTVYSDYDRETNLYFYGTGYGNRLLVYTPSQGITIMNVYMINTSLPNVHLVTYTLYDEKVNTLSNVTINVSKLINSSLQSISYGQTNFQGQLQDYVDSSVNYFLIFSKTGYSVRSFNLYPSLSTYQIILNDLSATNYSEPTQTMTTVLNNVASNLAYSNITSNLTLNFSQTNSVANNFCMYLINNTRNNASLASIEYFSCSASNPGNIIYTAKENQSYIALGLANMSGNYVIIQEIPFQTYKDNSGYFGLEGVFMSAMLIIVVASAAITFAGMFTGIILTIFTIIFVSWIGLLSISPYAVMGIVAVGLVIIVLIARRQG